MWRKPLELGSRLRSGGTSPAAEGEVAEDSTYVAGFDGLRGFAIAAVWLLHIDRAHFPGGAAGVDVFFALSAYLINGILLAQMRSGRVRVAEFYWRRAFRLVPAVLAWLIILAIPTALLAHQSSTLPASVPGALFYYSDFLEQWTTRVPAAMDQTWSLAVEEQFYLVWPVLLVGISALGARRAQRVALLGLGTLSVIVWLTSGEYFLPTGHLLAFIGGAGAAWAAQSPHVRDRCRESVGLPGLLSAAVLVAAVFVNVNTRSDTDVVTALVAIAATTLVFSLDVNRRSLISWLLSGRAVVWLGARSYGVYLYGLTLMQFVGYTTHLRLHFAIFVDLFATLAISGLSYRFIESPVRRRGREWLIARRAGAMSRHPVARRSFL